MWCNHKWCIQNWTQERKSRAADRLATPFTEIDYRNELFHLRILGKMLFANGYSHAFTVHTRTHTCVKTKIIDHLSGVTKRQIGVIASLHLFVRLLKLWEEIRIYSIDFVFCRIACSQIGQKNENRILGTQHGASRRIQFNLVYFSICAFVRSFVV